MISQAMLMAAGLGTRLAPFTQIKTKAMLPVLGVPMMQFSLDLLSAAGVKKAAVNIHHFAHDTRDELQGLDCPGLKVVESDETQLLLGSAGGLRQGSSLLEEDRFFLTNADVLCDVNLAALAARHETLRKQKRVNLTLALSPGGINAGFYREIFFDHETGLVTGFGSLAAGKPFFVGTAVIEKEALQWVPDSGAADFVQTILEPNLRQGKVGFFLDPMTWFDMGSPALWWQTHLSVLSLIENDTMRNPRQQLWKNRILKTSEPLAKGIWAKKGQSPSSYENWVGPVYWAAAHSLSHLVPQIGPNAILYGSMPSLKKFENGIGFAGHWVQVGSSKT